MRTIETKVFEFSELSKEAREKAIESIRQSYYEYNDFAAWAIDDCYLFEPKQTELVKILGENVYEGMNGEPIIGNTRKNIYFDRGRNQFLNCEDAIEVNNESKFLLWLGIPKELQDKIYYRIYTPSGRNQSTVIEFEEDEHELTDAENDILDEAIDKFSEHISDCLQGIGQSIDYHFTDEAIIEDIEANEYEFTEDGNKF